MSVIKVRSNIRDYEARFTESASFVGDLRKLPNCVYVVDENVWRLYSDNRLKDLSSEDTVVLPISEEGKSLESVRLLYDELTKHSAKRNMTLISIGGGILQDITGFAASTLYRGINWIFVPTTLLAQADSCIGAKTSLNYKSFKNLIGTFYPPSRIYIHTPFLKTLSEVDFFSGLGEVIKLYLMGGESKLREIVDLLPHIASREPDALNTCVRESLLVKLSYIADDEFDTGKRNMLNFGHCFGHALESVSNFEIPHGQAVVMGILLANKVARLRCLLSPELERRLAETVLLPGLVLRPRKEDIDLGMLVEAMKKDKKRTGAGLALIMMKDNYEMVRVSDLSEAEVAHAVESVIW